MCYIYGLNILYVIVLKIKCTVQSTCNKLIFCRFDKFTFHNFIIYNMYYIYALLNCSRELIMKYGVRVRVLGDLSLLPKEVLEQVARAVIMSQDNKNALLNVCFAYSSQHEITDAIKRMATGVEEGLLLSRYDIR